MKTMGRTDLQMTMHYVSLRKIHKGYGLTRGRLRGYWSASCANLGE